MLQAETVDVRTSVKLVSFRAPQQNKGILCFLLYSGEELLELRYFYCCLNGKRGSILFLGSSVVDLFCYWDAPLWCLRDTAVYFTNIGKLLLCPTLGFVFFLIYVFRLSALPRAGGAIISRQRALPRAGGAIISRHRCAQPSLLECLGSSINLLTPQTCTPLL
ncbi:hypothetical protein NDU88_003241 [Pleurodeles waltl]|uniref:Uncharacterized protein n=1 Tax=Pleurodeles waltl TaxID=8319 RepID=A0AAV7LME9_PLEWA|nr:hypothetical protein NDU88_003241 [Pleurodeles waltl]